MFHRLTPLIFPSTINPRFWMAQWHMFPQKNRWERHREARGLPGGAYWEGIIWLPSGYDIHSLPRKMTMLLIYR